MPTLTRDDGVEIHWESSGAGPVVVLIVHSYAQPEVLAGLLSDLARDHTVVTYDSRGAGRSSRRGPYDERTEAGDLGAVLEEVGGGPANALAWGEGSRPAVILAAERPDLVATVIAFGGGAEVFDPRDQAGTEGLATSDSVRSAILEMLATDYRGALRHLISATNTELNEDEIRERVDRAVEYREHESAVARARLWMEGEGLGPLGEQLGERLWVLQWPTDWFSQEHSTRLRRRLPKARINVIDPTLGPVSRPAITAAFVREATAPLR